MLRRLVLLPVAPVEGLVWIARTLQEVAEAELDDPATLRSRLEAAEEAHRAGEIDDDELAAIEDDVLQRLVEVNVIEEETTYG